MTHAAVETKELPAERSPDEPVVEDVVISVEAVTKIYRPLPPPGRLHRALMRVGGGGSYRDQQGDDDDDDDAGLEDDGEPAASEKTALARDVVALDGVSFSVAGGSCVAIVGPARAGKTTLMRIVGGLAPPTAGRVVLAGRVAPVVDDLVRVLPSGLSLRKAALILATMTRLPRRNIARRLPEIFADAGLEGQENRPVSSLSGKRRRLFMLWVMLAADPLILVYDATMPGAMRSLVLRHIESITRAGGAVLVTARDVEEVGFADRIIYLHAGSIIADGSQDEVLIELRRRRGADAARPPLSEDAARYAEFLRISLGAVRMDEVLHDAAAAAVAGGQDRVEWEALAEAAGVGLPDAEIVVDRLRAADAPQLRQDG